MFKNEEVLSEILRLIKSNKRPFTLEQLHEGLQSFLFNIPDNIYFSGKHYVVGQRLFHPSVEVNQWFDITSIENEKTLVVQLDNGEIKRFPHLSSKPKIYVDGLPKELADILNMVEIVLGFLKNYKRYYDYYVFIEDGEYLPLEKVSTGKALMRYFEELRQDSLLDDESAILEFERISARLGLESLYYIAPTDNLESILKYGIVARNLAPDGRYTFENEDIQGYRHLKIPNIEIPFTLHDYVPLFFCSKPPLLYRFRNEPSEVVKIEIDPAVLLKSGALFFNRNARSDNAVCYSDFRDLHLLDWEKIQRHIWYKPGPDLMPHRQAEADIPLKVPVEYFQQISVGTREIYDYVLELLEDLRLELPVKLEVSFF